MSRGNELLKIIGARKIALIHLACSLIIVLVIALLVFLVWYPYPYFLISGGVGIFAILVGVDFVCGPLLTMILYKTEKKRAERVLDLMLVVFIQLAALWFGIYSVYQARPLFLVHEVDRFRVIGIPDYYDSDVGHMLTSMPSAIRPRWFDGPKIVGIRDPVNASENQKVLFESVGGGRDYSQRPEFYVVYDEKYKAKALARAKPLSKFIDVYPHAEAKALSIVKNSSVELEDALFLPVQHRQDWVAVLDSSARVIGYIAGDGFAVN